MYMELVYGKYTYFALTQLIYITTGVDISYNTLYLIIVIVNICVYFFLNKCNFFFEHKYIF